MGYEKFLADWRAEMSKSLSDDVTNLFKAGKSIKEITEELDCPIATIIYFIKKSNLLTIKEITEELDVSVSTVYRYLKILKR